MIPDRDWQIIKSNLVDALVRLKGWSLSKEQLEEITPIIHSIFTQLPVGRSSHVCGLEGYNGMIDPPCPACEEKSR